MNKTKIDYRSRASGQGLVVVIIVLALWRLATGSISVNRITTRKAEIFYWTAILFSNTLGTALGDYTATHIELLGAAGLKRIEVTSFVRPDVVPQLADAERVLEAVRLPDDVAVSVLVPNERGLERALLGSTAERVIRGAPCPVMAIPPAQRKRDSAQPRQMTADDVAGRRLPAVIDRRTGGHRPPLQ